MDNTENYEELQEEYQEVEQVSHIKMDFSLETPEERTIKVQEIIANTPPEKLTSTYLTKLTDYIILASVKQDAKKGKKHYIYTDNTMVTVNKRETSYEGLASKFLNGEDGICNLVANDKNIIFAPKVSITEDDLNSIPGLRALHDAIVKVEEECKNARGRRAFLLHKQLKEMRKDQYVYKNAYKKPIKFLNITKSISKLDLSEEVGLDENNEVYSTGIINLYNPKHISLLLCNYSKIKEDCWDKFNSDTKWLMEDLDNLIESTLREAHPLYYDLVIYKIDGKSNLEIQQLLFEDHGIKHSVEYISSLWRNKIPKLLAEKAANDWLVWHYTQEEKGVWKKCSRCGRIKLAHNHFFSKNKTSKDGFYSICKECRNKKK